MKKTFLLALIIGIILLVNSCDWFKSNNPVSPTEDNKLQFSEEKTLINNTFSAGQTITVTTGDNSVNGMKIVIPENSFTGYKLFKISSYKITKNNFGEYVNPISPIFKITSNGTYIDGIYEVTIPVKIETGSFPLVFIYDEQNNKLEPLPVQGFTSNSVTFTTRHFATSKIIPSNNKTAPLIQADENYSILFVSSLQESIINQKAIISSGFKPGTDDWEFPNYGSFIVPGGQCSGQNMAAFWYYFEKKLKGKPNLYNTLSQLDNIWQENNRGYRFCSVIHSDLSWDGTFINFFDKYIDKNQELDRLKFYMIAGAMLVTGEPQGIGIYRETGTKPDGSPTYGGHDLICYQLEPASGKLYISDPNTPGMQQSINFTNNKFSPYKAKLNANETSDKEYKYITYYAKTAYIEWDKIATRWNQVEDYTIGNDKFPGYQIWSPDKGGFYLQDEFIYNVDTLNIMAETPTVDLYYVSLFNTYNKKCSKITVFDNNGNKIYNGGSNYKLTFPKPGTYKFGILVEGFKEESKFSNGDYIPLYIDYKWITINYQTYKVTIIPNDLKGDVNKEYTWNLDISSIPTTLKYYIKWNFNEGKGEIRKDNVNYITNTFTMGGNYKIVATIYDASSNKALAKDSATAEIAGSGGISPNYGPKGQTIIIKGSGFKDTKYSEVSATLHWDIDSTNHYYRALQTTVIDDNTLQAIVADETKNFIGKVYIKVRKYDSPNMKYDWVGAWEYEIVEIKPTSVQPDTLVHNAQFTISGSGFGEKFTTDNVLLDATPVSQIISWTNTQIVCVVPEMSYSGSHYLYIAKSCNDMYNCFTSQIKQIDWESAPVDIIDLMKYAVKEGFGSLNAKMICDYKAYNDKGEVTNESQSAHNVDEYLYNTYTTDEFTTDGRNFTAVVSRGSNGRLEYQGTISSDGKKLETATFINYDPNGKILLKMVLNNLPLTKWVKNSSTVSWIYSSSTDGKPYISDFYMATYSSTGNVQTDATMVSCSSVAFDYQFTYQK